MAQQDGGDSEPQPQPQQQQQYDWSAHYDDDGQLYYHNAVTGESAWEAPAGKGFRPPSPPREEAASSSSQAHDWSAHYDDEGQIYYYNAVTEESAWDPPQEGFRPPEGEPPVAAAAIENKNDSDDAMEVEEETAAEDAAATTEAAAAAAATEEEEAMETEPTREDEPGGENDEAQPQAPPSPTEDPAAENDDHSNEKQSPPDDAAAAAAAAVEESAATATEPQQPPKDDDDDDDDEAQPQPKQQQCDWWAHLDDEGRTYYHNAATGETTWDAPAEGFHPPEPPAAAAAAAAGGDDDDDDTPWVAVKDDDGAEYYYNEQTGETQWEKPERYRPPDDDDGAAHNEGGPEAADNNDDDVDDDDDTASIPPSPSAAVTESDSGDDRAAAAKKADEPPSQPKQPPEEERPPPAPAEPAIDPEVRRLRDAEAALNRVDSVLEPSCSDNFRDVALGHNPLRALNTVCENYHGQTAVCGLLARWLTNLAGSRARHGTGAPQNISGSSGSGSREAVLLPDRTPADDAGADRVREAVQAVINKVAKERFRKERGDGILDLSKSEAAFLEDMMDSPRWRKLLIDLSAKHKDSAVLLHCLRAISKRGHHREIARRINQSDHFAVFNAMLVSELSVLGEISVAAGCDVAAAAGWDERVRDLRRACATTAYTYLYSVQLLRQLELRATEEIEAAIQAENNNKSGGGGGAPDSKDDDDDDDDEDSQVRFRRAVRKWTALGQMLESCMIDPTVSMSNAGASHLFRKRQLDVALTISDLHQSQKRRRLAKNSNGDESGSAQTAKDQGCHEDLENALATLLRRHAIGTQLDDAVLDSLLPSGLDLDTRGVGHLLVRHPLAISALLGHLFKSGPSRIASPPKKNKCARLVALAVLAAEGIAKQEAGKKYVSNGDPPDELALTRMIVQGSQLCENLETMISFLVTTDAEKPGTSPGEKLCTLALKCAPVGLGAVIWARAFTAGPEYAASASFPTLSSSILSLVRIVAMRYPFARTDALHVALAFLRHSNSDISYVKVNSIKEHSLRLLIFLLIKGEVVPVLSNITARLKSNNSELDASLVRYFVAGVLEVVRPPVSPVFVRLFGGLLKEPRTVDAIKSSYFSVTNRKRLESMLQSFKDVRLYDGSPLGKDDRLLISALLTVYQVT